MSLVEWFLNFYEASQEGPVKPVEGIVRAGEVIFVPRGWWHLAMNLEVLPRLPFAMPLLFHLWCTRASPTVLPFIDPCLCCASHAQRRKLTHDHTDSC